MNESILQRRPSCPDDASTTTDDAFHEIQTHRKAVHVGRTRWVQRCHGYRIEKNPHLPSSKKAPHERRHSYLLAEIFEAEIVPLQQSGPCLVWGDASRHLQDTIRPTRPLNLKPQIHPRRENSLFDPDCAPDAPPTGHANNGESHLQVSLLDT